MLTVEEALQVAVAHLGDEVHTPVGHLAEHLLGICITCIGIGIAQTCQDLMLAVEGHPAPVAADGGGIAGIEVFPRLVDGLSSDEAVEPLRVAVVVVLTVLHHADHILQPLLQLCLHLVVATGGIGQREGCEVVTAHMTVEVEVVASPVGERRMLLLPLVVTAAVVGSGSKPRLPDVGCQQTIHVILHQHLEVHLHGCLHRSVEQRHLREVEMLGIEYTLCLGPHCKDQQDDGCENLLHITDFFI